MPEISRIALEWGYVANSLAHLKLDLLPEEIVGDFLAQWVMSSDALENKANQRGFRENQIDLDDHNNLESQLYSYLVASILQIQMPFFFASLFHIGRQWQVAVFTLESINDVKREENLFASARNLVALNGHSQPNTDLSTESAVALIRDMCELGHKQQSRQLNLAREWWQDWRGEVSLYRRAVDELQEYFNEEASEVRRYRRYREETEERGDRDMKIMRTIMQLLVYTMQGSSLRRKMQQSGVQFKPEVAIQTLANQQILGILVTIALTNKDEGRRALARMFDDFFGKLRDELRNQWIAAEVEATLEILKRKCEEVDPFMRYGVGKSAPTLELLELIREHRLPNGYDSPWLSAWKRTLDDEPNRYEELPKPRGQFEPVLATSVRSVDSTIKRNLAQQPNPTESWEDFLQRIFEKKWIETVGIMAGRTKQEAKSSTATWDLQTFQRFIAGVVAGLNKLGYSLTVPSSSRLASLLEQASKRKSWYDIDIKW